MKLVPIIRAYSDAYLGDPGSGEVVDVPKKSWPFTAVIH